VAASPARATPASRARPSTAVRLVRHAPLGRCLYCLATGGTGVPLTEEHLIPRALGGRLTLRDAVCEPCRRITGLLEQITLDREFVVPRTLLALKRRRARGKGPNRLPQVALAGHGNELPTLDADTFPRTFALPTFEPAGLLTGVTRGTALPRIDFVNCRLNLGTPTHQTVAATRTPTPARSPNGPTRWPWPNAGWTAATRGLYAT